MSQEKQPISFLPPEDGRVDLLIIAGEHSGDQHAAKVVRDLHWQRPGLAIAALGGPELAKAGAQLLHDMTASSVVGFVEVLKNYSFFKALFDETLRWIAEHKPRAVMFVDYPGMNLRIAKALHERGLSVKGGGKIKLLFYISPQIWAWKAKRRFTMAEHLDALAVIFPFEVECYADTTLRPEFVGHPFLAEEHVGPVKYDPAAPVLLLPGSRKQAVGRIFPVMLRGFEKYAEREAVVIYPSDEIEAVLRAANPPKNVRLLKPAEGEIVAASAVLTSSGTMSMHCALAGIPGAVVYRANPLTYLLGRMLVKVPYLGIANLLLKEPMYPEYIQGAATPEALAKELRACVGDPARRAETEARAEKLRAILRRPASGTAADWVLRRL
ncbi:lipid-A-disaccharide synthase [Nibricoccus aquaticus]|uniref:Lipid-A-disaccharide synthase n=1 Tax=Nibricoccus aquaticus TaxID=2576891 RepID=A0A290QLB6_9BACT|nr:lipid-A-disaccharide synthase [Nibricoccus aquaticus]ATC65221.1 lipid-A-disaccharide synthase [Nibricoccus aquaticus]